MWNSSELQQESSSCNLWIRMERHHHIQSSGEDFLTRLLTTKEAEVVVVFVTYPEKVQTNKKEKIREVSFLVQDLLHATASHIDYFITLLAPQL